MASLGFSIGAGIVVFAATNIDDLFVLSAFFSDARYARRSVIIGQFVGIGALVLVSFLAARLAVAIPEGWIALLGLVPLVLGLYKLPAFRRCTTREPGDAEKHQIPSQGPEPLTGRRLSSQTLAVAAVTIANGGDNLGAYIPLFAGGPDGIPVYASVFAAMTAIWCMAGYLLVNNCLARKSIRHYGHIVLPLVLIALGLYILSGATALFL